MGPLIVLLISVLVIGWLMLRGRFSDLERQIKELASARDENVSFRASLVQRVFALEQERKKSTAVSEQTPARLAVAKELVREAPAPVAPAAEITPLSIASAESAPAPPVEAPSCTVTASRPTSDVVPLVVPPVETPAFRAAAVEAVPVQPVETPEIAQREPEIAAAVAAASEAPPLVVTPVPPAPEIRAFRAAAFETARVQPVDAPPAPGPVTPPPEPVVAVLSTPPSAPVREPEDVGPTAVPDVSPIKTPGWRERVTGQEWEAVVGGNWLNKLGVLVLVIGIALFLGYSFTRLGPAGRVSIGLAVSLAMLGGGVVLERRQRYAIFARGLVGGGWAALYFTIYAMQAVETARVIYNPYAGAVLLFSVAAGMILHSLRYRSQTVTGLAYFIAFSTLVITPATAFSVAALVPLAISLLYVAYRFGWSAMAFFGLLATYGTAASRGASGASLAASQSILGIYWIIFESFDLFRASRGTTTSRLEHWIFPLNALGFLVLSYGRWTASTEQLAVFFAGSAAVYLASTLLRAWLRAPSTFGEETTTAERVLSGGYEGALTLTALLVAAAAFLKFSGVGIHLALAIEAEALFLAGLVFGQRYLRQLAAVCFGVALCQLYFVVIPAGRVTKLAGHTWNMWSPLVLLTAALFSLNRALHKPSVFYSYAASLLVTAVFGAETPQAYLGVAWLIFATALFELGVRRHLHEFLYQAYAVGLLGLAAAALVNIADQLGGGTYPWAPLAWMALVTYAAMARTFLLQPEQVDEIERVAIRRITSVSAVTYLAVVEWTLLPPVYLGLGWLALAAPNFEFGLRRRLSEFRYEAYAVALVAVFAVAFVHLPGSTAPAWSRWVSLAVAGSASYGMALRRLQRLLPEAEERVLKPLVAASAVFFLAAVIWKLVPEGYLALAWLLLAVGLFELGLRNLPVHFRKNSYVVAGLGIGRLLIVNVLGAGKEAGLPAFISLGGASLLCYAMTARTLGFLPDRIPDRERILVREIASWAGTAFLLTVLWIKLPAPVIVVGWALVALLLIETGFAFSLDGLRLQGNLVSALTFGRLFLSNFTTLGYTDGISHRLLTVVPVLLSHYYIWSKYRDGDSDTLAWWESRLSRLYLYTPALLGVVLLRFELGRVNVVVGWASFGLALYWCGAVRGNHHLRWQSYAIALLAFWRSWTTNFYIPESLGGAIGRIVTGSLVIACLYAAQLVALRRREENGDLVGGLLGRLDRNARLLYCALATTLLTVLLYFEVSGSMLTIAWGIEGVSLLLAGFPLRERVLRLAGLALFFVCVLKLFVYDLRELETLYRIFSFIALGLILLGVSWIYTRFRGQLQRYL